MSFADPGGDPAGANEGGLSARVHVQSITAEFLDKKLDTPGMSDTAEMGDTLVISRQPPLRVTIGASKLHVIASCGQDVMVRAGIRALDWSMYEQQLLHGHPGGGGDNGDCIVFAAHHVVGR